VGEKIEKRQKAIHRRKEKKTKEKEKKSRNCEPNNLEMGQVRASHIGSARAEAGYEESDIRNPASQ
jgi:hypothetical protein